MDHTIDDSDRLKPCPFCGGKAEFGEMPHSEPKDFGARYVECLNPMCRATTALVFGEDARINLLERWNKRHNVQDQRGDGIAGDSAGS